MSDVRTPVLAADSSGTRRQRVHRPMLRASLLDRVLGGEIGETRKQQTSTLPAEEIRAFGDGHLVCYACAGAEDRIERLPLRQRARLSRLYASQRDPHILGCRHGHEVLRRRPRETPLRSGRCVRVSSVRRTARALRRLPQEVAATP